MMRKQKKIILLGFIFGFILPIIGIFVGLQVSAPLATVMLFPVFLLSEVFFYQPFGELTGLIRLGLFIFSGIFWAFVFWLISITKNKLTK